MGYGADGRHGVGVIHPGGAEDAQARDELGTRAVGRRDD